MKLSQRLKLADINELDDTDSGTICDEVIIAVQQLEADCDNYKELWEHWKKKGCECDIYKKACELLHQAYKNILLESNCPLVRRLDSFVNEAKQTIELPSGDIRKL